MYSLDEVRNTLARVIVSYHDSQSGVNVLVPNPTPVVLHEAAESLLADTDSASRLNEIIEDSTKSYDLRKPLLRGLAFQIQEMDRLTHREIPFSPDEMAFNQKQLAQFILDIKALISLRKTETTTVNWWGNEIKLHGLTGTGFTLMSFICRSGELLQKELLHYFTSDKIIADWAQKQMEDLQNTIIAQSPLGQYSDSLAKIEQLTFETDLLTTRLNAAISAGSEQKDLVASLSEQLNAQNQKMEAMQRRLDALGSSAALIESYKNLSMKPPGFFAGQNTPQLPGVVRATRYDSASSSRNAYSYPEPSPDPEMPTPGYNFWGSV